MILKFITSNDGKLAEAQRLFKDTGHELERLDLECPEIQADALEDVVKFCLDWLGEDVSEAFIAEDSGLFIDRLAGFPGVYSSFVAYLKGRGGLPQRALCITEIWALLVCFELIVVWGCCDGLCFCYDLVECFFWDSCFSG